MSLSVFLDHLGQVYTCGYGALGLGPEIIESLKLEKIKGLKQVSKIYASTDYAAALTGILNRTTHFKQAHV